jgi:excisionase family DNA binding protein
MKTKEGTMPIVTTRNQGENDLDFLDRLHDVGQLLTVKELARILSISEKTIYGYVSRNMIPYLKIQSSVRFRPKHIAQWLTRNDVSACYQGIKKRA